jgi:hypothetical protein
MVVSIEPSISPPPQKPSLVVSIVDENKLMMEVHES